jgi:hypothetical protein
MFSKPPKRVRSLKVPISEDWLKQLIEEYLRNPAHPWIHDDEEIVEFRLTFDTKGVVNEISIKLKKEKGGTVIDLDT